MMIVVVAVNCGSLCVGALLAYPAICTCAYVGTVIVVGGIEVTG
jgi:hypothetical protein